MEEINDSFNWLEEPFKWWESNNRPILMAIPLASGNALNLMAALEEVHDAVTDRRLDDAVNSLEVLGTAVIAKTTGRVDELFDIIAASIANTNIDAELQKLLEEDNG